VFASSPFVFVPGVASVAPRGLPPCTGAGTANRGMALQLPFGLPRLARFNRALRLVAVARATARGDNRESHD
jgi:hypothetical protein